VLFATRQLRTYALVVAQCTAPVGYMAARAIGGWDGELAVRAAALVVGEDRAMSLEFRLINEQMLLDHASLRRMFGWGTQGDSLIKDSEGEIISVPDGLWVIAIGTMGLLGLGAFYGATLLPILLLRLRARPVTWDAPLVAGASALAVALGLHAIDNLFNAMSNPFFLLAMGGLTGLAADARQTLPAEFPALSRPVLSQSLIATAPRMPVPAMPIRPTRAPDATDEELICEDLPDRPPEAS
jgi:hypothetical protein